MITQSEISIYNACLRIINCTIMCGLIAG